MTAGRSCLFIEVLGPAFRRLSHPKTLRGAFCALLGLPDTGSDRDEEWRPAGAGHFAVEDLTQAAHRAQKTAQLQQLQGGLDRHPSWAVHSRPLPTSC